MEQLCVVERRKDEVKVGEQIRFGAETMGCDNRKRKVQKKNFTFQLKTSQNINCYFISGYLSG